MNRYFIVLLEIGSYLILKFNFINQKVHTYLTLNYVEVLKNQNVNLKKNVELKIDDWNIYTDKNRLRVKSNDFDHNLENDRPKIIFIGDTKKDLQAAIQSNINFIGIENKYENFENFNIKVKNFISFQKKIKLFF